MTNIYRLCVLIAVLSFSAGSAKAQFVPLMCQTNVGVTPTLRSEGYTEPTGDITYFCTGGPRQAVGSQLPQVNIALYYNTAVTSRLLPVVNNSNVSEALLILDDPGSGVASYYGSDCSFDGTPRGSCPFGTQAPQTLCPTPAIGCVEYVNSIRSVSGSFTFPAGTELAIATNTQSSTPTAATQGYNMFQGIVGGNTVTFFGVPILAPVTTGAVRTIRITNVRVNASALGGLPISGAIPIVPVISISGGISIQVSNVTPTVGFVQSGLSSATTSTVQRSQCASDDKVPVGTLSFSENFPNAFRTRIAAQTNVSYAGSAISGNGVPSQNIPGAIYSAESNFTVPLNSTQTGLADFGTRLKAVFNNIPAGVRLFVSTTNVLNASSPVSPPAVIGGTATSSFAQLVSSETVSDGDAAGGFFPAVPATGFAPGGTVPIVELPVVNGSATAIWEVVNTVTYTNEVFKFAVYESFTSNVAQNSPPPGSATVNLSFAPAPPAFAAGVGAAASANLALPRFIADPSAARNLFTISSCIIPQTPAVTINAPSSPYGAAASIAVAVSSSSGATPTGTVSVSIDGGAGAVKTLSSGVATFPAGTPNAGAHTVSAAYCGDTNYIAASANGTLTISKANTTTVLSSPTMATVSAVAPGAGVPTGTVQFMNGSTVLGSAALNNSVAVLPVSTGTGSFTAVYSGDANFNGSTSSVLGVAPTTSSMSLSTNPNPSTLGQSVTITASVGVDGSRPAGALGGSVQFFDNGKLLGSSSLNGAQQALLSVSSLTGGSHTISATYSGDSTVPSAQASITHTVNAVAPLTLTSAPASPVVGQTVVLTASVVPSSVPAGFSGPTGTVDFLENGFTIVTGNLASGVATANLASLIVGTHKITAVYRGDGTWSPSFQTITLTVSQAETATALSVSLDGANGVRLKAMVVPTTPGTGAPSGDVVFVDTATNTPIGSAVLSGGGATLALPASSAARPIAAAYSGDDSFKASTSPCLPVVVGSAGISASNVAPDSAASAYYVTGLSGDNTAKSPNQTALGAVNVTISDSSGTERLAMIYGTFASTGQINFVVPAGSAMGSALLTVSLPNATKLSAPLTISATAPGLFTANMDGKGVFAGQVVYVHADGSQIIDSSATLNTATNTFVPRPIHLGAAGEQVYLILYGTGIRHATSVTASVNGVNVPVVYAAQPQYMGLDQINLQLPPTLGAGPVSITITADGRTANTVTAMVQ
jgi:uncharacterized protein (TIGR03437 family)